MALERGALTIENSIRPGSIRAAPTPPKGPPISHIGIDRAPNTEVLVNRITQATTLRQLGSSSIGPPSFDGAKASISSHCITP